jgi:hypothetical protein
VLTTNAAPRGSAEESYRRAMISESPGAPKLIQTTTKSPLGAEATLAAVWASGVCLLTGISGQGGP